jgi:hypothetical protein
MDAMLLSVAWAAGITSLFLVADTIAADLINRRTERLAQRQHEISAEHQRRLRRRQ